MMAGMAAFDWAHPFLRDEQLSEDERMIRRCDQVGHHLSKSDYRAFAINPRNLVLSYPPCNRLGKLAPVAG